MVAPDKTGSLVTISSYDQLIDKLKSLRVKPQEAYDLVYKNKFEFNARYYWTMTRINLYLKQRLSECGPIFRKYGTPKYKNTSIFKKIIDSMPKKIASIREVVRSDTYKKYFKIYNPKAKLDERKEWENLSKLVTEKRHNGKFLKQHHQTSKGVFANQLVINLIR
jgi:hypothetical protein